MPLIEQLIGADAERQRNRALLTLTRLNPHIPAIQNKPWIILDFKSVPFMDSRALEILLRINVTLKQRGSVLKIIGLSAVCRDILTATRLINVFHAYEYIHKAIRAKA